MPDRRIDVEARSRIEALQEGYERFASRVYKILVVLVVINIGVGVVSIYLRGQNQKRADEAQQLAERNAEVTKRTAELAKQIQVERADATRSSCLSQNSRNRSTKRKLDELHFNPEGAAATRALIDALAPVQDCAALTKQRVGEEGGG